MEAVVELVLEVGAEPARDAVAQRARVGIATVYRHFPDQQALLQATARYVLENSIRAGERLIETVPDGVAALRQYMHQALDNGIGVVNIIYPLLDETNWPDLKARAEVLMNRLVSGAAAGTLRSDLSVRDIVFALTRFARPLSVGLLAEEERDLAHRHLDFYLDGLYSSFLASGQGEPTV